MLTLMILSYYQKVKDKYLLLLSVGIVMIEVVYVIPLPILTYVRGDTRLEIDSENPSFINASFIAKIIYNLFDVL